MQMGESIRMNDRKEYFKTKLVNYMYQCAFDEATRETYIKKLLHDKKYKQKMLSKKSENVAIEIDVLQEMLEEVE